jgi:hypothetical protein
VTLVRAEKRGEKNIVSGGYLKYVDNTLKLPERPSDKEKQILPLFYASAGFWYDAFRLVSKQITEDQNSSDNQLLQKQRICLIEQVGLGSIAQTLFEEEGLDKEGGFNLSQCHMAPSEPAQN